MRHLVLSLLVLGFPQSLQAKLEVSSSSGEKGKDHLGCVKEVEVSSYSKDGQPNTPVVEVQDNKDIQRTEASATDKPSSEPVSSHNNKDSQQETIINSQVETTSQKTNSTASVDDQKKQSGRTPAQASDEEILSEARFCFVYFDHENSRSEIRCNEQNLNKSGNIPSVGHYLVTAGFIPGNCWNKLSFTYCIYYKP